MKASFPGMVIASSKPGPPNPPQIHQDVGSLLQLWQIVKATNESSVILWELYISALVEPVGTAAKENKDAPFWSFHTPVIIINNLFMGHLYLSRFNSMPEQREAHPLWPLRLVRSQLQRADPNGPLSMNSSSLPLISFESMEYFASLMSSSTAGTETPTRESRLTYSVKHLRWASLLHRIRVIEILCYVDVSEQCGDGINFDDPHARLAALLGVASHVVLKADQWIGTLIQ